MGRINFYQTNYIGKTQDKKEIKICPFCKNVFDSKQDICDKCNLFLPSFPTSWARSATNIFLLRKVLEFINIDLNKKCDLVSLTDILTKNNIISYDHIRKSDINYWKGGPTRRAAEYLTNLQYLGFVIKSSDKKYNLTDNGEKLADAKDYSTYIELFANAFMALKIGNQFDIRGTYSEYDNHILFLCLRIINDLKTLNKVATIENLALAIMCKNETTEYQKALDTSTKYTHTEINNIYFSRGQEFNRVVRGVFVRWLHQTKMIDIDIKGKTIFVNLTNFGKKIFDKYEKVYIFSQEITKTENISNILQDSIDKKYLRLSISKEINNRTGAIWENIVKDHFNKISIDVKWYKETQDFVNIVLPAEVLASLTGGTRHNPDLILQNPLWLIDPKKDANAEMHKVVAYDKYGEIVKGFSVIVSQKIMKDEKIKMMKTLGLKNVLILDGYALQVLSTRYSATES